MRGNSHVRFLGEKGAAMPLTYPMQPNKATSLSSHRPFSLPPSSGFSASTRTGDIAHFPIRRVPPTSPTSRFSPSCPPILNWRTTFSPFLDAWLAGAADQLMGQIASAKIPLSRMISPALYWVMSADEFSLDINNPEAPKILCIGNNPEPTVYLWSCPWPL